MEDNGGPANWIASDENAKTMLARVVVNQQSCLAFTRQLPPFHRVPLRAGNVVEIVGPSASAKSELLIQAAVNCILPKEWKGVRYGGSEGVVMLFDLDCRFDIPRLAHCLRCRIHGACEHHGPQYSGYSKTNNRSNEKLGSQSTSLSVTHLEDEMFRTCMERFLYIRCYSSFEFLAALKTIRPQFQKAIEKHSNGVHLLMIDRRPLSLQVIWEVVVQELRHLLQINTMLVLATKPTIYSMPSSEYLANRDGRKWSSKSCEASKYGNQSLQRTVNREYMPAVWQAFVTHRLLLGKSEEIMDFGSKKVPVYTSEWETPSLRYLDRFIVEDGVISLAT